MVYKLYLDKAFKRNANIKTIFIVRCFAQRKNRSQNQTQQNKNFRDLFHAPSDS